MFLAVNPGRTGTTWKPAPTARLRPDDPARGVCLTRVAPCKGRVGCKHCDSRMALAISAPLLAQIRTCICVSSSVTCVQKRTVSGQLVRIHCPNSQWSRRPLQTVGCPRGRGTEFREAATGWTMNRTVEGNLRRVERSSNGSSIS